jgi:hypothetical protein
VDRLRVISPIYYIASSVRSRLRSVCVEAALNVPTISSSCCPEMSEAVRSYRQAHRHSGRVKLTALNCTVKHFSVVTDCRTLRGATLAMARAKMCGVIGSHLTVGSSVLYASYSDVRTEPATVDIMRNVQVVVVGVQKGL